MRMLALLLALVALLVLPSAPAHAVCTQAGFDQALCELAEARTAPFCGPRSLKRTFKGTLSRARRSVRRAKRAFDPGRSANGPAALARAGQQLAVVIVAAATRLRAKHINPE